MFEPSARYVVLQDEIYQLFRQYASDGDLDKAAKSNVQHNIV